MAESLEEIHERLYVLQFSAIFFQAVIDFLEEVVLCAIDVFHHFLAVVSLPHSEFVVDGRHFQCRLKSAQVGQCCEVVDAQVGGE